VTKENSSQPTEGEQDFNGMISNNQSFIGNEALLTKKNPLLISFKSGAIFILAAVIVYLVIVGPSLYVKAKYFFSNFGKENIPQQIVDTKGTSETISGAISSALRENPRLGKKNGVSTSLASGVDISELTENQLLIPKINVNAPIIWNSSSDEQIMLENLRKGVAHYGFTSTPNTESGNVFITGHSSYYWWDSGKYKTVFALINKLVPGDQIILQYQGLIYVYEVTESIVVSPAQVEVTDHTEKPTISLMTCTPVGTALNRLVVKGKLAKTYLPSGSTHELNQPSNDTNNTNTPTQTEQPTNDKPSTKNNGNPQNRDLIKLVPGRGLLP